MNEYDKFRIEAQINQFIHLINPKDFDQFDKIKKEIVNILEKGTIRK